MSYSTTAVQLWVVEWDVIPINEVYAMEHSEHFAIEFLDEEGALQRFFALPHPCVIRHRHAPGHPFATQMIKVFGDAGEPLIYTEADDYLPEILDPDEE